MIESKLKAKNCNRGQLFRPCWVSSARCGSNEVISWSTTHRLNSDGDDLRWNSIFCSLAHVTCKTHDKGQQEKSRISIIQLIQFALRSLVHYWQLGSVWRSFIASQGLYKIKGFPITSFIDSLIDLKHRSCPVHEPKMIVVPSLLFLKVFRFGDRISNVQMDA